MRRRPSTVIGITSQSNKGRILTYRTATTNNTEGKSLHREKWDSSIKPSAAVTSVSPINSLATCKPPLSTKSLRTQSNNLPTVGRLKSYNKAENVRDRDVTLSKNRAVQEAFDRAINSRTVTGDRLRLGLITNDITPRMYLQVGRDIYWH